MNRRILTSLKLATDGSVAKLMVSTYVAQYVDKT